MNRENTTINTKIILLKSEIMKKIILLASILAFGAAHAQFPVWINSFDSAADLEGWTFHDLNGNGNGWVQGQNIIHNGTTLSYGTAGVLRYSINLVPSGTATGFAQENDWIISPQIDLTSASGTILLAAYVGRQRTTHATTGRSLYIYVSTPQKQVPELSDFQAMAEDANGNDIYAPNRIYGGAAENPFPTDLSQFVESQTDLTAFAGKKIYIGMWSNRKNSGGNVQNINIDEMAIFAETLGVSDIDAKNNPTKILKNPVASQLLLEANPALLQDAANVKIYSMMGQEVLVAPYSNQIDVAALQAGVYIAHITDGVLSEKIKFIKK